MMVYRDEVYRPDTKDKGIAEIIVGKNRAGETGTAKLACSLYKALKIGLLNLKSCKRL